MCRLGFSFLLSLREISLLWISSHNLHTYRKTLLRIGRFFCFRAESVMNTQREKTNKLVRKYLIQCRLDSNSTMWPSNPQFPVSVNSREQKTFFCSRCCHSLENEQNITVALWRESVAIVREVFTSIPWISSWIRHWWHLVTINNYFCSYSECCKSNSDRYLV